MARPPVSRRERRKQEVRERILEAARELFLAQGVRATPVSAICARADVAQQTFFNHFPTKQHVVRAMAQAGTEELLANIELAHKKGRDTRERVQRFLGGVADVLGDAGPMHRELVAEIIHANHEVGGESEQARRLHDAVGAIVREGLAEGDVTRAHDFETLTELVLGAYYVMMFSWAHLPDYPIRTKARAHARLVAAALAPGSEPTRYAGAPPPAAEE